MSDEQSERTVLTLFRLGRSIAALSTMKTLKQFYTCKKAGRDPDICFLEAFMGIYTTLEFPGPPLPEPFKSVGDLHETLKQAVTVFSDAAKLAETYKVELEAIQKNQMVQQPR